MDKPRGGRGHIAPYETKQMRVPVGLETQIQELVERYRDWISDSGRDSGIGTSNPPRLLDKPVDNFSQAQEIAELRSQLAEAKAEVERLKPPAADTVIETARDRVLAGLKLGRQSSGYKSAAKLLTRFISELQK